MFDELRRAVKASRIPLPIDNHGANAGDLWAGDGRFIGNIDEPLYAAVLVAAVNALPEMERLEAALAASQADALMLSVEAARLREALGNLIDEHEQSDEPGYYAVHVSDFDAAVRALASAP